MKAKLVVVGGTTTETEVRLQLPAIIGRGRSVQVAIPHSLVSRKHCEISESDGRLLVRDLDSLNGTYVGDERIERAILDPGALLTVGTVTFRAVYEVGGGDSRTDELEDTCCAESSLSDTVPSSDAEQVRVADHETVPVVARSSREATHPSPTSGSCETSDEAATEQMSNLSTRPSFESTAKNSE